MTVGFEYVMFVIAKDHRFIFVRVEGLALRHSYFYHYLTSLEQQALVSIWKYHVLPLEGGHKRVWRIKKEVFHWFECIFGCELGY